jgi:ComF family protein
MHYLLRAPRMLARSAGQRLMDLAGLFYPITCATCDEPLVDGEDTLCLHCLSSLPWTRFHRYRGHALEKRFYGRVELDRVMAWLHFVKGGQIQHLLHEIKYRDRPALAFDLGRLYGSELRRDGLDRTWDALVPVPMHRRKARKRGYNVAALFAEGLAKGLAKTGNLPIRHWLRRTGAGSSQTDKDRFERWDNVRALYALNPSETPPSHERNRVLLVDDVVTTGATLEACAGRLLEGGAASVSICCLASAVEA